MTSKKTYSELISLPTFEERFNYLKLGGNVGEFTFNGHRELNQMLYNSQEWRSFRREVAIRDDGCDLAHPDYKIRGNTKIIIHHLNPIRVEDTVERSPMIFDLENVITTTMRTHQAIHYGDISLLISDPIIRTENDTCLWR